MKLFALLGVAFVGLATAAAVGDVSASIDNVALSDLEIAETNACRKFCHGINRACIRGKCIKIPLDRLDNVEGKAELLQERANLGCRNKWCNDHRCCKGSYCMCDGNIFTADDAVEYMSTFDVGGFPEICSKPGAKRCAKQNRFIEFCTPRGEWALSRNCGGPACCKFDDHGRPMCRCGVIPPTNDISSTTESSADVSAELENSAATDTTPAIAGRDEQKSVEAALPVPAVTSRRSVPPLPCSQPGRYGCGETVGRKEWWVMVCNTNRIWQAMHLCGNKPSCCRVNGFAAQCYPCSSSAVFTRSLDTTPVVAVHETSPEVDEVPESVPPLDRREEALPRCNTPGQYECANNRRYVVVCAPDRLWHISSDCGRQGCCMSSGPKAYCICSASSQANELPAAQEASQEVNETPGSLDRRNLPRCNRPGRYDCANDNQLVAVCAPDGLWHLSADCGKPGCCKKSGTKAFCICSASSQTDELSTPDASTTVARREEPQVSEETSEEWCWPDQKRCARNGSLVQVCDATRRWKNKGFCFNNCCREFPGSHAGCICSAPRGDSTIIAPELPTTDAPTTVVRREEPQVSEETSEEWCLQEQERCAEYNSVVQKCDATRRWRSMYRCMGRVCKEFGSYKARCVYHSAQGDSTLDAGDPSAQGDSTVDARDSSAQGDSTILARRGCAPGHYKCSAMNNILSVCDARGVWQLSARCPHASCKNGEIPGTAYCMQGKTAEASIDTSKIIEARNEVNEDVSIGADSITASANGKCQPGHYSCFGHVSWSRVEVCGVDYKWHVVANCGGRKCCQVGPNFTAYCKC